MEIFCFYLLMLRFAQALVVVTRAIGVGGQKASLEVVVAVEVEEATEVVSRKVLIRV